MNKDFTTTRDWIATLSGIGAANFALGSLRQLGVIGHLPDPPIRGFDSDAVLMSRQAFAFGIPDAPIALAGMAANIPLARVGGPQRTRDHSWIPILIAAKAVVEVSVATWSLVQMRTRIHAWCAYCLVGFSLISAIAALTLVEANAAVRTPRGKIAGIVAIAVLAGVTAGAMRVLDARAGVVAGRVLG